MATLILWIRNHSLAVFIILVSLGSLRIAGTYSAYSHTSDEPLHIACGLEWLSKGFYRYEPQHPPLARVAAALGPYLAGVRSYSSPNMQTEGLAILFREGHQDRNLALARLGILPFFWIASTVVYLWAKKYYQEPAPALAVSLFTFLPPVLAHAGLATTDMALTGMAGASFLSALAWTKQPSLGRSLLLGGITGLAVLCKFSALPFIPVSLAAALICHVFTERPGIRDVFRDAWVRLPAFIVAVISGFFVIWAGYRFSFGAVPFASFRLPAPELYAGIQQVITHNRMGHAAYLFGAHSQHGWWYYYFVILALKTPLPFLALLFYGIHVRQTESSAGKRLALSFSLGVLLFSLTSNINIGVRHILPVYIGFAVVAGAGAARLLERQRKSIMAAASCGILLGWMMLTSVLSHPDYLPYFNALAGSEPERMLVDSDLDWGQDAKRLVSRLKAVGAEEVAYTPFFLVDPVGQGFPRLKPFDPLKPSPGWNAANLTVLKSVRYGLYGEHPEIRFWADEIKPAERIGKGIWLWHFPPEQTVPR